MAGTDLKGKIIFITGASSGIGAVLAEMLIARGAKVVGAARNLDKLKIMANRFGSTFLPWKLDVTDGPAVSALPLQLPEGWRDVSVLINNAGHDTGGRERLDDCQPDELARIIEVNVVGMIRVARAFAPHFLQRGSGDIVNVGSTSGHFAIAHDAAYVSSKFAINGLTRALRADYEGCGIRIIEVSPGVARTGFAQARYHDDESKAASFYERFPAVLEADDVARAIIFALEQPSHVAIGDWLLCPVPGPA
jgi:3-hydroxy acid dehydrogenase/malonic semialdehyde reductase